MENSTNTGKLIGALIAGAFAGAALGILFAPDKGSKTRSRLAGRAKDLAGDLKKKITEEINDLRRKTEELESLAEDKLNNLAGQQAEILKN